jgi:hypothetical protein
MSFEQPVASFGALASLCQAPLGAVIAQMSHSKHRSERPPGRIPDYPRQGSHVFWCNNRTTEVRGRRESNFSLTLGRLFHTYWTLQVADGDENAETGIQELVVKQRTESARRKTLWNTLLLVFAALALGGCRAGQPRTPAEANATRMLPGYIDEIPPESARARRARHRRIAERRAQPVIIMIHRGATAFAPENTLEACSAAMDYGADGCEIDIRCTSDGVLYLFHDDTLDRMVATSGKGKDKRYAELLGAPFDNAHGMATPETRIPTLAALLELARRRAMLLHLDIKESGLQDDLIRMFDEADVWDHIVHINPYNSDRLLKHEGIDLYNYKGWVEEAGDLSKPEVAERFLSRPGKMIFCKGDPRQAVRLLGREETVEPVPLPAMLRKAWPR